MFTYIDTILLALKRAAEIIRQHCGFVAVISERDVGTTMIVHLPKAEERLQRALDVKSDDGIVPDRRFGVTARVKAGRVRWFDLQQIQQEDSDIG